MSIFNNNKLDPFGTNSLFADINKTNQEINAMNLPAQPTPQEQDFKRQRYGNMMLALSDVLRGKNPSAGVMQRQTLIDAQKKEAERKAAFDKQYNLLNENQKRMVDQNMVGINLPTATDKTSLESYGIYNIDGAYVGAVNKGDINEINKIKNNPNLVIGSLGSPKTPSNESMELYSITDGEGRRIKTVVNPTKADVENINDSGYFINKLPTATDRGEGLSKSTDFDPIKSKYLATQNIILGTSELAEKFYKNPTSALAVGGVSQFVDSVIQNIDAGSKILSSAKDKKSYKFIQSTSESIEGNDFGDRIKSESQSTGVAESRIRDLAYLFAAARGQEGRGLSDKDYENALRIVSGGVGVEGRIKVLEDVSNRIKSEFERDVKFDLNMSDDKEYINKLNKLQPLPTFINPLNTINSDPLNIRQ